MILILITVLASAVVSPAHAASPIVSSGKDAKADVKSTAAEGLSPRNRKSIDIRKAWISQEGDNFRFTVKIRRVAPTRVKWDQMVFFTLRDPANVNAFAEVGFTQRSNDLAYAYDSVTGESCDIAKVTRDRMKQTLSLLVPGRCMPTAEYRAKVKTSTGFFRTDAPTWSRDNLRLSRINYR